jgi:hypothetical protein
MGHCGGAKPLGLSYMTLHDSRCQMFMFALVKECFSGCTAITATKIVVNQ